MRFPMKGARWAVVLWLVATVSACAQTSTSDDPAKLNQEATALLREHKYAEAEPLYRRALAIYESTQPADHPLTAQALNNLGWALVLQRKYSDSEEILKRAIAMQERGGDTQRVGLARSATNLAYQYTMQRRYAESEPLLRRAIAIQENAVGPQQLGLARSLNDLANVDFTLGRYAESLQLALRSVSLYEAQGANGAEYAAALFNLGRGETLAGNFAEAERHLSRAAEIRAQVDGRTSLAFFAVMDAKASSYLAAGRAVDLLALEQDLVGNIGQSLGTTNALYTQSLFKLAYAHGLLGRYADAERIARELLGGERLASLSDGELLQQLTALAALYRRTGRAAEAEPFSRRALTIAEQRFSSNVLIVEAARGSLAVTLAKIGRIGEAKALLEQSLPRLEASGLPSAVGTGVQLAMAYRDLGQLDEARRAIDRALLGAERMYGRDSAFMADFVLAKATIAERSGDLETAALSFARVLELARLPGATERSTPAAEAAYGLARIRLARGQSQEALRQIRVATEYMTRLGDDPASREAAAVIGEQKDARAIYLAHVGILAQLANSDPNLKAEAFKVGQLANLSAAGRALSTLASRFAAGSGSLAQVVRERQDTLAQLGTASESLVQLLGKASPERSPDREAALKDRIHRLEENLTTLNRRLESDFPRFAELAGSKPLAVQDVQKLLAPDEALLAYLVADDRTYLWSVRRERSELRVFEIGAKELASEVGALRTRLDPQQNPQLLPFDSARAYALYRKILAPATADLVGMRHVLIVPDGALQSLPIGVLVTEVPVEPGNNRRVSWLARKYAVTVLPSVPSLGALRLFAQDAPASSPFFGVGDPILEGDPGGPRGARLATLFRGGVANVDAVRRLPALPDTADELKALASGLGVGSEAVYLRDRATEATLKSLPLDRYRVVAFATHGLVAGDLSGLVEPALVLTPPKEPTADDDGLLTASEVAQLKLNADWVVLSACNTAASDGTPGADGLSGLARAFFYAGSRALMVSHWPVASAAAVRLTTAAFAELRKEPSIGRAEALRRSEIRLLEDDALPADFSHPAAWAPFVVVGEGAPGR